MSTALLVIDAQVNMFKPQPVYESGRVMDNLLSLLDRARAAAVPVVFVQNNGGPGEPDERETEGWLIHPSLSPERSVAIIEKWTPDSFHQTTLAGVLAANGITHVIIAGMQTEYCIDTTTRRASSLGYRVTLVADAHSTYDGEVTAEQTIAHHNRVLRTFANVTPTAEVTFDSQPPLFEDELLTTADLRAISSGLVEWEKFEHWLSQGGDPRPYWPQMHPGRVADALRMLWDKGYKPHGQHVAPPRWELSMAPQFIQPLEVIPLAFRRAAAQSVATAVDHLLQNPRNPFSPQMRDLGHGLWSYETRDLRLIYVPHTTQDVAGRERNYVFLIYVAPAAPVKNPFA